MTLVDVHFRNIRVSFFKFLSGEFAKTDYAKNNIQHRGEFNTKLQNDNVRCRLDIEGQCGAGLAQNYKDIDSPSDDCNNYICPEWMPTMFNFDEIDYQAQDRRIVRIDFINKEIVHSRYNVIQIGIWSNKKDDRYKHKLYLLRDVIVELLGRDVISGEQKKFTIIDWDDPDQQPPAIGGRPPQEMQAIIHLKETITKPVDGTTGEFGEVLTLWLMSSGC